jgi:hypothetical protein
MSEIKSNKISPATGTAFTFGDSGDTFTIPSGATITNNGTANGFGVSNKVVAVHLGSDQSLTKNVIAKVQFDVEDLDANGWFDNSTNYRFTPDEAGDYFFSCELTHGNGTGADNINLYFYKNGSEVFGNEEAADTGGYVQQISGSAIITMNGSSDYVEVYTRNGSTGTLTLDAQGFNMATATQNRLCIARLT